MHEQAPSKIHIASQAYLAAWTVDGLLQARDVRSHRARPKSTAAVAWRRDWWGIGNPDLNARCEQECAKIETQLPEVLGDVEGRWPLAEPDRLALASFMTLHVLRTPAFAEWFVAKRDQSIESRRADFSDARLFERWSQTMRSDGERATRIFAMFNKIATVLGCMNWTLLRFDEPLLITSDQPVCPFPLLDDGAERAIAAMPQDGWLDTIEVRCPLSPHLALLASWHMSEPGAPVMGTWEQAVNINALVRTQADRHWLYSPARMPALPSAILREPVTVFAPIGPEVLSGYDNATAKASPLRDGAGQRVEELIQRQDDKSVALISVVRDAA